MGSKGAVRARITRYRTRSDCHFRATTVRISVAAPTVATHWSCYADFPFLIWGPIGYYPSRDASGLKYAGLDVAVLPKNDIGCNRYAATAAGACRIDRLFLDHGLEGTVGGNSKKTRPNPNYGIRGQSMRFSTELFFFLRSVSSPARASREIKTPTSI
jgi:hypothetical protein